VAKRRVAEVRKEDLNFFPIKLARVRVDGDEQSVTARTLGFAQRTAYYREGLGCTLLPKKHPSEQWDLPDFDPVPVRPEDPEVLPWPAGDVLTGGALSEAGRQALSARLEGHFDSEGKRGLNTRALLVVYRGQLLVEHYAPGIDRRTILPGWSLTKSITNALIGIRIGQGKMAMHEPVPIAEWQEDERRHITLNHLLRMSSGLSWREVYHTLSPATRMLYEEGDLAAFASARQPEAAPDLSWVYSSGTTNILAGLLRDTFPDWQSYWAFPRQALFNPVGMRSAVLEADARGAFVGSSYGWANARDWARFGLLYLQDGWWGGKRILPEGWVTYSMTPAPASGGEYGAQIWLNAGGKIPTAPRDMYMFQGFQEQRVFVIPSRELVVVRLGTSREGRVDFGRLLEDILARTKGSQNNNLLI